MHRVVWGLEWDSVLLFWNINPWVGDTTKSTKSGVATNGSVRHVRACTLCFESLVEKVNDRGLGGERGLYMAPTR